MAMHWLAVMGAEVIKVESCKRPDMVRRYNLTAKGQEGESDLDKSPLFASLNLSKRSCTLDLTRLEAQEILCELIKLCDVVAENFGPGVMERLRLDYTRLRELKDDLIVLSMSGLGRTGPLNDYRAYATTAHAFSGLSSITGYEGGRPISVGAYWSDHIASVMGAFSILASLHHRDKTGQGQYIDLSMTEATIATMPEAIMDFTMNQRLRSAVGNHDDIMAPHGCYPCMGEDDWVVIAVTNDEEWLALCQVTGNPQ